MSNNVNQTPKELDLWRQGEALTAKKLSQPVDAINRIQKGIPLPKQIVTREFPKAACKQFKIKSIQGDYITCNSWDGTTLGTEDVLIAKPYLLRKTPFHNLTRNSVSYVYSTDVKRTATKSPDTETQVIVPEYVVGDIILALSNIIGGTSITSPQIIIWNEVNESGRAWAKE